MRQLWLHVRYGSVLTMTPVISDGSFVIITVQTLSSGYRRLLLTGERNDFVFTGIHVEACSGNQPVTETSEPLQRETQCTVHHLRL